jgi:hypothetical protein
VKNGTIVGYAGKCLDLFHFNTVNGASLVIYDCNGGPNQKWILGGQIVGSDQNCVNEQSRIGTFSTEPCRSPVGVPVDQRFYLHP